MTARRLACAAFALVLAAGCGQREPEGGGRIAFRFIDEDPPALLDLETALRAEEVARWGFGDLAAADGWKLANVPGEGPRVEGDALVLDLDDAKVRMVRHARLDAGVIGGLRLDLVTSSRLKLVVYWAGPGQSFAGERSRAFRIDGPSVAGRPFEARLADHPAWSGRIETIRLDLRPRDGGRAEVRLRAVSPARWKLTGEGLAELVASPWKAMLGQDTRNALVVLPGMAAEREVELPEGAELRFAYGMRRGAATAVRFVVEWREEEGPSETLFEDRLDEARLERWNDVVVDLGPYAGRAGTLALRTTSTEAFVPAGAVPLWANPEILRPVAGDTRSPNVVLVSADTLRADHLSLHGYGRPTTPHLDRWAGERAVVFENAVAAAPWTLPSHVSLFSGQDALRHGVNFNHAAPGELRLLAEVFRDAGYRTIAVTGGGWLGPRLGLAQGFDVFRYSRRGADGADRELQRNVADVLAWLDQRPPEPFFLFLHTFETHSPHLPRQPYFDRFSTRPVPPESRVSEKARSPTEDAAYALIKDFYLTSGGRPRRERQLDDADDELLRALYDSGIAHLDATLAPLLARLTAGRLGERTAVVLTSDHGEALGEKGLDSHGYLYDFNLMVPLVLSLPGGAKPRRIAEQVRSVDVMPTLLDVAGIAPPDDLDGVSLLPLLAGGNPPPPAWSYASSSNQGVSIRIGNRLKYVYNDTAWEPAQGAEEVFDLRRDADESVDLSADPQVSTADLRAQVGARLAGLSPAIVVTLTNDGATDVAGTIRGDAVDVFRVKAFEQPRGAIRFTADRRLAFRVAAGGQVRFTLTNPDDAPLSVALDADGSADGSRRPQTSIPPPPVDGTSVATWDGRRWGGEATASDGEGTFAITLRRIGAGEPATDPTTEDAELREQLRALGYL